jgi:hypothetical protein
MTIDEAFEMINAAPKGKAQDAAREAIKLLDENDQKVAAQDLEEMAILIDFS